VTGLQRIGLLIEHQLRGRARSVVIWGAAIGALGALYVALYPSMSRLLEQYVEQAPEQMRNLLGDLQGPITIEQWLGMELINGIIPIALPFLVISIGARTIAGSEERKSLDLLLSNPLRRWQLVVGSLGTMAASLASVLAIAWALTYVAVPLAGVDLGAGRLASGLTALWPMCLFFGALALLASSLFRKAALAISVPGVVLVAMYVIDGLAQVTKSIEPLRVVSLFHHLGRPLEGDFPWTAVLLTLAGACVLTSLAIAAFSRRDIYT
ncbi:MAG TPA: ABC transporter permease subunit, partial [Thermoleophilia bacterium]|nr:ABC transporter permease subunit [Thermoleophilia bacterium]